MGASKVMSLVSLSQPPNFPPVVVSSVLVQCVTRRGRKKNATSCIRAQSEIYLGVLVVGWGWMINIHPTPCTWCVGHPKKTVLSFLDPWIRVAFFFLLSSSTKKSQCKSRPLNSRRSYLTLHCSRRTSPLLTTATATIVTPE